MRVAAVLALLAAPAAAAEAAWHGLWAADPAWCPGAAGAGAGDGTPVEFTADTVRGRETACRVEDVASDDENAFHVVTSACEGEGMIWAQVDVLMLADDGAMWRWMGHGAPIRLVRCGEG